MGHDPNETHFVKGAGRIALEVKLRAKGGLLASKSKGRYCSTRQAQVSGTCFLPHLRLLAIFYIRPQRVGVAARSLVFSYTREVKWSVCPDLPLDGSTVFEMEAHDVQDRASPSSFERIVITTRTSNEASQIEIYKQKKSTKHMCNLPGTIVLGGWKGC